MNDGETDGNDELEVADFERSNVSKAVDLANQAAVGAVGAGIAMGGSPLAVIAGAASVPILQAASQKLIERRAQKVSDRLAKRRISLLQMVELVQKDDVSLDLFRMATDAALSTASDEKRNLLIDIMVDGLLSDDKIDQAYARRVLQSLDRIDAVEVLVLNAIDKIATSGAGGSTMGSVGRRRILDDFPGTRVDIVDGGVAVLVSEGLVTESRSSGGESGFALSEYGRRLLAGLTSS